MLGFNLVQDAIGGLNALDTYRPVQLLGGAAYLKVFSPQQFGGDGLALPQCTFRRLRRALISSGCSCVALGYLTFTSVSRPNALGVLMAIAGACYLANSAAVILSPLLASMLFPPVLVPAFIGELSVAVWLTVKGVNVAKWQEMAERSRR